MSQAAKSLLYAKQHLFEYRDRTNKKLASILAQRKSMQSLPEVMVAINREEVNSMPDKLMVFVEYYYQLYDTSNPSELECILFWSILFYHHSQLINSSV